MRKTKLTAMKNSYGNRFFKNDIAVMPQKMPAIKSRTTVRQYYYSNGQNKDSKIEIVAGEIYGSPDAVIEDGAYNFPNRKAGSFDKVKFIAI